MTKYKAKETDLEEPDFSNKIDEICRLRSNNMIVRIKTYIKDFGVVVCPINKDFGDNIFVPKANISDIIFPKDEEDRSNMIKEEDKFQNGQWYD